MFFLRLNLMKRAIPKCWRISATFSTVFIGETRELNS